MNKIIVTADEANAALEILRGELESANEQIAVLTSENNELREYGGKCKERAERAEAASASLLENNIQLCSLINKQEAELSELQRRIETGVEFEISRSDGGSQVYMTRPSSGIQAKLHAIWFHEIQPGEKRKAHIVLAEKE